MIVRSWYEWHVRVRDYGPVTASQCHACMACGVVDDGWKMEHVDLMAALTASSATALRGFIA